MSSNTSIEIGNIQTLYSLLNSNDFLGETFAGETEVGDLASLILCFLFELTIDMLTLSSRSSIPSFFSSRLLKFPFFFIYSTVFTIERLYSSAYFLIETRILSISVLSFSIYSLLAMSKSILSFNFAVLYWFAWSMRLTFWSLNSRFTISYSLLMEFCILRSLAALSIDASFSSLALMISLIRRYSFCRYWSNIFIR